MISENKVFEEDEIDILQNLSVKHYLNFVLIDCGIRISKSDKFGDNKSFLFIKKLFDGVFDADSFVFDISDEIFFELSDHISIIHDDFIWRQFTNDKGRKITAVKEGFEFIKPSHYLFKNLREKIIQYDLINRFSSRPVIRRHLGKKVKGNMSFNIISNKTYLNKSSIPENTNSGRIMSSHLVNYYSENCCFGITKGAIAAAEKHLIPSNMVTFDISKFFNTFDSKMVREKRLFENIYECINSKVFFTSKGYEKKMLDSSFIRNSKFFYSLFDAFSYKNTLPTGSVFSADITNLLFFSVDVRIKDVIREFFKKRNPELNKSMLDLLYRYTRYVDDIAISVDLNIPTLMFMRSDVSYKEELIKRNFLNMNIVKEVEEVLNSNGFYLNYDKTKIYSHKMSKQYLGFTYNRTCLGYHNFNDIVQGAMYELIPFSKKKYEFRKLFYNYANLSLLEKKRVKGMFFSFNSIGQKKRFYNADMNLPDRMFTVSVGANGRIKKKITTRRLNSNARKYLKY